VDGGLVRYNQMPTESIDYTLKYGGGCEANGDTLKIQLGGDGFARLEDKPWNAPCTNLVPLAFEATLGPACSCKIALDAAAFGPDSRRQGFIWREACGPNDHVCVKPETRDETAQENQLAPSRISPEPWDKTVPGIVWNNDTCKVGYVWREACGTGDHVCVPPSMERFRKRIREITCRAKGVSIEATMAELVPYLRGWRGYFGFCETPEVLISLIRWVRLRLRAALWRQWKTPRRRRAALLELGVRPRLASNTAGSGLGLWYLARAKALSVGLSNAYFESLGLPSLVDQ
jgi:hypothetical protein